MATITPGTGSTISAATLEEYLVALIDFSQSQELDSTKNPNSINNLTSSVNRDSSTQTVTVNLPCDCKETDPGVLEVVGIDYLSGVVFSLGTGATLQGSNWVDCLIKTIVKQKNLEMLPSKNPTGIPYIQYSISPSTVVGTAANATFNAQLSLPVVYNTTTFPSSYKGKVYLND